jgi:hypothetical protein
MNGTPAVRCRRLAPDGQCREDHRETPKSR